MVDSKQNKQTNRNELMVYKFQKHQFVKSHTCTQHNIRTGNIHVELDILCL